MALDIVRLHPLFGAEIRGVSIGRDLPPAERRAIHEAVTTYGVAVIRGQALSDEDLGEFAMSLGQTWRREGLTQTDRGVFRLSNMAADGGLLPVDDRSIRANLANELWHTDGTFAQPGASVSLLHSRVIPPEGGDTEFCDTRVAYEALDEAMRQRIASLVGRHSFAHSRAQTGYTEFTAERRAASVPHRLVRPHAASGRTALCLASHICEIEGLTPDATADLLDALNATATAPERVHVHSWRVGDLVMWDNRCTMHRVRPYAMTVHPRDMRSVRLVDTAAS
ncbi:MAG: tfdA-like [Caulobacteraceae bacterium]|nr:tfdA-like [Caulobacteraceae bacterium]